MTNMNLDKPEMPEEKVPENMNCHSQNLKSDISDFFSDENKSDILDKGLEAYINTRLPSEIRHSTNMMDLDNDDEKTYSSYKDDTSEVCTVTPPLPKPDLKRPLVGDSDSIQAVMPPIKRVRTESVASCTSYRYQLYHMLVKENLESVTLRKVRSKFPSLHVSEVTEVAANIHSLKQLLTKADPSVVTWKEIRKEFAGRIDRKILKECTLKLLDRTPSENPRETNKPIFGDDGIIDFQVIKELKSSVKDFTFVEEYDMKMILLLLTDSAFLHRNKTKDEVENESNDRLKHKVIKTDTFSRLKECMQKNEYGSTYEYTLGYPTRIRDKDAEIGRLYDTNFRAVMYMNSAIRSILYNGKIEVDQKSAHPNIFVQLYKGMFKNKEPEAFVQIMKEKDTLYPKLASELECSVGDIKLCVCCILFGGTVEPILGNKHPPTPTIFKQMIKEVREVLKRIDQVYPEQYEQARKEDSSVFKNKKTTLSYTLCDIENAISCYALHLMIEWGWVKRINDNKISVGFLHDGMYIDKNKDVDTEKLSRAVSERVGFEVNFGIKTVDPSFTHDEQRAIDAFATRERNSNVKTQLARMAYGDTKHNVVVRENGIGSADVTLELVPSGRPVCTTSFFHTHDKDAHIRTAMKLAKKHAKKIFGDEAKLDFQIGMDENQRVVYDVKSGLRLVCQNVKDSNQTKLVNVCSEMIFVKASMNGGKSYLAFKIAVRTGEVIYVAPTQSLVNATYHDLKNDHGMDKITHYKNSEVIDHTAVCTTVDSLQKIRSGTKVVIIDEASKVVAQLTSATMDKNPERRIAAHESLKNIIQQAEVVIVLDADLTDYEVNFFRDIRPTTMMEQCVYFASRYYCNDYRFTANIDQAKAMILQKVFVQKEPIVVPSSTVKQALDVKNLLFKYANGEINLYAAKIRRSTDAVIQELMDIHRIDRDHTIKMVEDILTRAMCCVGKSSSDKVSTKDDGKDVKRFKKEDADLIYKSLVVQKEALSFKIHEYYIYAETELKGQYVFQKKYHEEPKDVVYPSILVYSPCISVGMSFQTDHYKCCIALFGTCCCRVDTLLQMTNRFRKISVIYVYAAVTISKQSGMIQNVQSGLVGVLSHLNRKNEFKPIEEEFMKMYTYQHQLLYDQSTTSLKESLECAIVHSNPFNRIRHLSKYDAVAVSAGRHKAIETVIDRTHILEARTVSEEEYECRKKDPSFVNEKSKFKMVNKMFADKHIPQALEEHPKSILCWLNNFDACRFIRCFKDKDFNHINPTGNMWHHLDQKNLSGVSYCQLYILLKSLGFTSGQHFIEYMLKGKKRMALKPFKYEHDTVMKVIESNNEFFPNLRPDNPLWKNKVKLTYMTMTKLLKKLCPQMGNASKRNGELTIHKQRIQSKYVLNKNLLDFVNGFLSGEPVVYKRDDKTRNCRKSKKETKMECNQTDKLGLLEYFSSFC